MLYNSTAITVKPSAENILGFNLNTQSGLACVADIVAWIQQDPPPAPSCRWLACLNPHSYAMTLDDRLFAQALHAADWLIPDGAGIVLASKLLGGQICERVTGSDIFRDVQVELNRLGGYRVFFLGATEGTLAEIRCRMAQDYPRIHIAGTYSPPFKAEFSVDDNRMMIAAINAARPDVLWVGMSAPKQEKWLQQHHVVLNVKFAAAVGAVFDFYSGRVKRSPPVFQRLSLEWLLRLLQQPRRLWRRMGISAPIFLLHLLQQRFSSK